MKKLDVKKQILEKITIMEQNTFLFPKSWSETIDIIDEEWSYRTYNSGGFGNSRYHKVEIYLINKKILDINFRGTEIEVIQNLDVKPITYSDILKYITYIFNEKHSFKNHNEGKRKIRESIKRKIQDIETAKKLIIELKQQLADIDKLK